LAAHVPNLGTLNEEWLEIPRSAKVIFYPLPFCPSDEAYLKVSNWVRAGGVLYLSGDISYDQLRRRSRTHRLEELCGVRFVSERYPNIAVNTTNAANQPCLRVEPTGAKVLRRTADGSLLKVENHVGRGRVVFTTDPVELHSTPGRHEQDLALYRGVLQTAHVAPLAVTPDDPRLNVLRLPLRDKGTVWILFNTDGTQPVRTFTVRTEKAPITLTVARHRPALLWFNEAGALRAVETQGACAVGNDQILVDGTRGIVLTLDGKDVTRSHALLLLPLQPGQVSWRSSSGWGETIVETGDVRAGAWLTLSTQAAHRDRGLMRVQVSEDQALSMLLVCERSALKHWRSNLERMVTNPASLP